MNQKRFLALLFPILLVLELFSGVLSSPMGISDTVAIGLLTALWMVLWWIFEILPLGITALIPLVIFPLTGVLSVKKVAPFYSNSVIYLFLGGFIIARSLEKTRLSERIALYILKWTGHSDMGILLGFTLATSFLSMWISNTATTVMMVPIALSVLNFLQNSIENSREGLKPNESMKSFSVALFLCIAYSANIGGITTPIGTPPNVVLMGYLDEIYGREVPFETWMIMVVPIAVCVLGVMLILIKKLFPFSLTIDKSFRVFLLEKIKDLGVINFKQKKTLIVFSSVCFLWVFKGLIHHLIGFSFLNDTSIAIYGGVSLFFLQILDKEDIPKLPWDIVLLFGGGMALAGTLNHIGVIKMATTALASLNFESPWTVILITSSSVLFLTEIMSNVALCVVALPLLMKLGETGGVPPLWVAIPATLCASFAFSMPISTPPNTIVFGTGRIQVKDMLKAGILLNIISIFTVMSVGWFLMKNLIH